MTLTRSHERTSAARGQQRPRAAQRDSEVRAYRRRRDRAILDGTLALTGLGFGATIGLAVTSESWGSLSARGGLDTALGRLAGLAGGYAILMMVLLMARIPWLERALGQDRLSSWHRRLGPWPVVLITAHVVFITFGYAESARTGFWHQYATFLSSYPDMLAATVGFLLLVMAAAVSVSAVRRRLRYETWWAVHLYMYLALALAFAHQIVTGAPFVANPLARAFWTVAWAATAGTVLVFRFLMPVARSLRHRLRVVAVREEGLGVVSIVLRGRKLERLGVEGGEFFQWRFLQRGLWWQAHPYSLSALPAPPFLRVTIRVAGDHGRALAKLKTGTAVAIEGPYGTFTGSRRRLDGVLLVAAGVGVTPVRALLEALPAHVDVTVIVRASSREQLVLHDEIAELVQGRANARLHEILGPRTRVRVDKGTLRRLVPDVGHRDVYVCGPSGFAKQCVSAARHLGVPPERIHHEAFSF